jgi:lipid A 3-O-deacylase
MRSSDKSKVILAARLLLTFLLFAVLLVPVKAEDSPPEFSGVKEEKGENLAPLSSSSDGGSFFGRLLSPDRKGVSLELGSSYDPNFNISSILATVSALYDHGRLWDGVRSHTTWFKLEAVAGSMVRPEARVLASINMLALYYPDFIAISGFRPYLEAGIGGIYTDYRVERQGLRLNFNPQLGAGAELRQENGSLNFVGLRLHHISNGGLHEDNRGVNSLLLQLGRFF